jgi:hypothetical protein
MPEELPSHQEHAQPALDQEGKPQTLKKTELRKQWLRHLAHDVLSQVGTQSNILDLLGDSVPQELRDMMRRSIANITDIVRTADDEQLTLSSMADFHATITKISLEIAEDIRCSHHKHLHIVTQPFSGDEAKRIPFSLTQWRRVLDNLMKNAARKGANHFTINMEPITFERSQLLGMQMTIRDDGIGMPADILFKLQSGQQITDKSPGNGMPEHDTVDKHGRGFLFVREFIEKSCAGEVDVHSVEASLSAHDHGTTILIRLPFVSNGENAQPPQPPPESSSVPRRRFLKTGIALGVGTLASAAYFLKPQSDDAQSNAPDIVEDRIESPVTDVSLSEKGVIQGFTFQIHGKKFRYEKGKSMPAFRDVREFPLPNASIVVFDPLRIEGLQLRTMFLCSVPEGLLCFLDVPRGPKQEMGIACVAHEPGASSVSVRPEDLFLLEDTVYHDDVLAASNVAMLQSPELGGMKESLAKVSDSMAELGRHVHPASGGAVHSTLRRILKLHELCTRRGVNAASPEELRAFIEDQNRFIIADRHVASSLKEQPFTREDLAFIKGGNHQLCFKNTHPEEARIIVPRFQ